MCTVSTAHMTRSSSGARSRLAFAITNRFGQAKVFIYDPGRPKALRAVTRGQYGPVPSIAWSPDGRRLLFVRTRG